MGKALRDMILWALAGVGMGIVIVALFAGILMALSTLADAEEAVPTYDARLGEQDRSLNYRLITTVEAHAVYIVLEVDSLVSFQCRETNLYLLALMENIAKHIAIDPVTGYMYEDALYTIRKAWCND